MTDVVVAHSVLEHSFDGVKESLHDNPRKPECKKPPHREVRGLLGCHLADRPMTEFVGAPSRI